MKNKAYAESFFSFLKKDKLYGRRFKTRAEARMAALLIRSVTISTTINPAEIFCPAGFIFRGNSILQLFKNTSTFFVGT